ncbi:MAG: DUF342 domain-containing protein [Leptospiraceae bacterium]|nr:DUF342 domain-containing protein [Leptospiraceae bacterium]
MDRLKAALLETDKDSGKVVKDRVEVVGLSIASCLNRAAEYLNHDLSNLDYEILERGRKSFFKSEPYRIQVSLLPEENRYSDLEDFSLKLGVGTRLLDEDLEQYATPKHLDGSAMVRHYRRGVFLTVKAPLGDGKPISLDEVLVKIQHTGITNFDESKVRQVTTEKGGEAIKIGNYVPRPEADSSVKIEVTPDEMKAYMKVTAPRPGGRHLEAIDVVTALKAHGVVFGFKEDDIHNALLEDRYMQEILAAEGQAVQHGKDAVIDYKVKIKKEINLEEDAKGRIDFKQMNLVENVVVGQVLAERIPPQPGKPGRTLTNRIVPARDGKDVQLTQGKGTILSDDGSRLIAEINGQVVYSHNRISVEPVYRVVGDVGPKTGNIMFLGSVVIGGNVLDNYEVKAAGNVEVGGSVQKARIEAEGDIIVRSGVQGSTIESTGGSLFAKFIQNAEISVATDIVAGEGILHTHAEAGNNIHCNGRRAQIVGGNIRATREVRARMIGSQAYTATEIHVGTDPRLLSQSEELNTMISEAAEKLTRTEKTLATLQARQKADPDGFDDAQLETLEKTEKTVEKLRRKKGNYEEELQKLEEHMSAIGAEGKVHAEKELFPGVVVTIRDASQNISDQYNAVTLSYDNKYVKIDKLEKAEDPSKRTSRRR